ncbi:MAG: zinc ABC transporter substrate-binding protein [Eubacteriales bacterium]|nr:zinc ABC transporter substrate-binding protein [Eubacteriales bacterium]
MNLFKQRIARFTTLLLGLALILPTLLTGCKRDDAPQLDKNGKPKPVVYTSFFPIYSLVKELAGDTLDVRVFVGIDKDPHLWEPTPRDMQKLHDADLLIVNGANMERWLDSVRSALPNLEVMTLSDSVELITYKGAAALGDFQYAAQKDFKASENYGIEFGHTHEDLMRIAFVRNDSDLSKDELIARGKKAMEKKAPVILQHATINVESDQVYAIEMGHESGDVKLKFPEDGKWVFYSDRISEPILAYNLVNDKNEILEDLEIVLEGNTSSLDKITYDPHSWLSIVNTKKYANAIHDELVRRYPDFKRSYRRNKVKLVDEMTSLEYEYREKFKDVRCKEFVVTHNAYSYLARDFGLCQFPLQGLISTESPSLKTIRKAIDFCNYYKISTIFYEYGRAQKGADTLANELGGQVKPLASMEYLTPEQRQHGDNYVDLMKMNLENLYEAMK